MAPHCSRRLLFGAFSANMPATSASPSLSALPSLTQPALYEQVAERLRTRIYAHELAPGAWVDEQALANEYGISRTPMREALKVLAAEGSGSTWSAAR